MKKLVLATAIFGSAVLAGCDNPADYIDPVRTHCVHDQDAGKFYMFHEGVPGAVENGAFYESVDTKLLKTMGDGTKFYSGQYSTPDKTVTDIRDSRINNFRAQINLDGTGSCALYNGDVGGLFSGYHREYELKLN